MIQRQSTASDTDQCDEHNDRLEPVIRKAIPYLVVLPDPVLEPATLTY